MSTDFGRPALPMAVPMDQQNFNQWVWSTLTNLSSQLTAPSLVSNLRVTPQPGGNLIDFTRSDGDAYTLYLNTTASIDLATRVQLGTSNRYTHAVGVGGQLYYYAVRANKGNLAGSVSGWIAGTTLAVGTPAVAVTPLPATEFPFKDQETDSTEAAYPVGPRFETI